MKSFNYTIKIYLWLCFLGPSNQACVGPDRPTSSSLVSLYPALGYRAIMHEMSPTAFGEGVVMSACVNAEKFRNVKHDSL